MHVRADAPARRGRLALRAVCALVLLAASLTAACGSDPERPEQRADAESPGRLLAPPTEFHSYAALDEMAQKAVRIRYRSTSGIDGSATTVSGVVFVPQGEPPPGGWPIASIGHPTTGINGDCAPSLYPDLLGSLPTVLAFLARRFLVVMTDYQGLGTPGPHPYLEPKTAAYNVIDAVRAAREVAGNASDRWVTYGVSQGGQAAWAANEMADEYGTGLQLVGSLSLAPPTDIRPLVERMVNGTLDANQKMLLPLVLKGLQAAHPELDFDDYVHGEMARRIGVFFACRGPNEVLQRMIAESAAPGDLKPVTPEAAQRLRKWLGEYSIPIRRASSPMFVAYGERDDVILPAWTADGLRRACALGDIVEVHVVPGQGHSDLSLGAAPADWTVRRFAEAAPANSCAVG